MVICSANMYFRNESLLLLLIKWNGLFDSSNNFQMDTQEDVHLSENYVRFPEPGQWEYKTTGKSH